jgi:hypothetical protein
MSVPPAIHHPMSLPPVPLVSSTSQNLQYLSDVSKWAPEMVIESALFQGMHPVTTYPG